MVTQTIPLNGINVCCGRSAITLLVINAFLTILNADTTHLAKHLIKNERRITFI